MGFVMVILLWRLGSAGWAGDLRYCVQASKNRTVRILNGSGQSGPFAEVVYFKRGHLRATAGTAMQTIASVKNGQSRPAGKKMESVVLFLVELVLPRKPLGDEAVHHGYRTRYPDVVRVGVDPDAVTANKVFDGSQLSGRSVHLLGVNL